MLSYIFRSRPILQLECVCFDHNNVHLHLHIDILIRDIRGVRGKLLREACEGENFGRETASGINQPFLESWGLRFVLIDKANNIIYIGFHSSRYSTGLAQYYQRNVTRLME